jgi:hypothetical protein
MYNVIGDIAGQFKTLQALIAKMPQGTVLSVGDMIDRGPRSNEVVEFFMNGGGEALRGNHEDLCLEFYRPTGRYHPTDWHWNGGDATERAWGGRVPDVALDWMASRPLYKEIEADGKRFFVSHAFVRWDRGGLTAREETLMWNRSIPVANPAYDLQICGHNSQFGLQYWGNPAYAVCIDTSRNNVLTGIRLPSGKIYEQAYID